MLAGRSLLYPYFGLESPLVIDVAALAFLAYAAIVAFAARREAVSRTVVMTIAAANAGYVVGSAVMLLMFWPELQPVGRALIVIVAIAVEAFATLQFAAGRRAAPAAQPA
jgi:CHASE2 domain-containing sensor protein